MKEALSTLLAFFIITVIVGIFGHVYGALAKKRKDDEK